MEQYYLANLEKVFGTEENWILQQIIEKNSVEYKNNFFDYYKLIKNKEVPKNECR